MASQSQSLLLDVSGEFSVEPVIYIKPTVARASPTANVGFTLRKRCTITNTGSAPIANFPYAIDLGDTTPLTTTKAQADADDVRVIHNGQEVARTLTDWDSATHTTLCWIVIPYLGAGQSLDWDIWYGNTAAVSGGVPALTLLDDLPAFDIAATGANRSSNAKWIYKTQRVSANAGKGGWGLSTGAAQPNISFGVPGAWIPLRTKLSDDDCWQEGYSTYVDTGTYYQGRFEARRSRAGALTVGRNSGDDGVSLTVPPGIESVRADIRWTNLEMGESGSDAVGKVVILTRNSPDEEWAILYSNSATQATEATIATATYTPAAAVREVAFAVWPFSGENVNPAARPDRYINAGWYATLEVNIDDSIITQSLGSEETIYEVATELRHGGGGDTTAIPPYKSIYLGNAKSASGEGTPRLAVDLGNSESVKVDCARRKVEIWNTGLTAKVEDVAIPAVLAVDGVRDVDGATVEQVSADWMPLMPVVNPLTNPSFDADASNWSIANAATTNMTVSALARTTGQFDSTPASGTVTVDPNTAAADARIVYVADDYLPVGNRKNVSFGMAVRTANANILPKPQILFYDAAQALISSAFYTQTDWTAPTNTWHRRLFAAPVPETAVYWRVAVRVETQASSATGQVWWDSIEVNDTEIAILDVSTGTIVLTVNWTPRYAYA